MSGTWGDDSSVKSLESNNSCYDYNADSTSDDRNYFPLGKCEFNDAEKNQFGLT